MLQAIVFDFDGVLADTEPLHYRAILETARPFGCEFTYEEYLERYVGFDDRDALRAVLRDGGRPEADDSARISQLVLEKGAAFERIVGEGVRAYEGTVAFVREAASALPLALASGATRRDVDLVLGRLGLLGLFDPVVTADVVARSKPDPETYRLALEGLARRRPDLAIAPERCLAIEDTAAGIASAKAAGLATLGLATTVPPEELRAADRVVRSLEGIRPEDLRRWY
ncbi:MAG: HAD family hydrolase [Planctomycetota bacterium]